MVSNIKVLGIETTCDETAAAVFMSDKSGGRLLSNKVFSQIKLHQKYCGVVPELASRAHCETIADIVMASLAESGAPDMVAFANGPGLSGALLVGRVAAQTIADFYNVPLTGVNHLEGHLLACELTQDGCINPLKFPLIALIVSGGHTELWICKGYGKYRILGKTRDDAAGEAFDKVAKLLGIGYPGGPAVEKLARKGDPQSIKFPRPFMKGSWEFSFSGLKTAVSYYLRDNKKFNKADVCAAFQSSVADTLVEKTIKAAQNFGIKNIAVGGGVAANEEIRIKMRAAAMAKNLSARFVEKKFCADNGAMIALCAYKRIECGQKPAKNVRINPELSIKSWA
ncbi:MAG: tRNA (adenosine(37)-N6)-threonylcarbamoyltransferase complex transferase subunit TsaD [Elusimicrobia bacterium]|nr:tRNA (adenosine(37)-N6)-threonylcarbamoyltransferase complex transferase subunit TsaD [Elusimicrobiota bacterium]